MGSLFSLTASFAVSTSLALSLSAAANAQDFVVPTKANIIEPGSVFADKANQLYAFFGSSGIPYSRVQYLYAVQEVPVPTATLNALSVRPPTRLIQAGATYQSTIMLSVGPNTWDRANNTFASNHGANVVTVVQGPVSLPATTDGPWPRPWAATIPFSQVFPYDASLGSTLVVDFEATGSSTNRSWTMEGYQAEAGTMACEHCQYTCLHSGGHEVSSFSWSSTDLVVGGTLTFDLQGYPTHQTSFQTNVCFLGATGQGTAIGPLVTPFLLSALGVAAPPNCYVSIDVTLASVSMRYEVAGVQGVPNSSNMVFRSVPIPNLPSMAGVILYAQDIALDQDPISGAPSLYPSSAVRISIGSGLPVPVSRVLTLGSGPVPDGGLTTSNGATVRFHY